VPEASPAAPESEPRDSELASEQAFLDRAYARLDAMRAAARSVREAFGDVQRGGTHQARLERDIAYELTAKRLAALQLDDAALCFGRLDLLAGDTHYIGRLGVDDEDREPLVVDWRAPVAAPFYRATAVEPMGVVRRRHFQTRHGRELVGIDDEVFDKATSDARDLQVAGEGALMAALDRERTGRMSDIVATIQAEQDIAIRAGLTGPLVLSGGPGTGKTAVALHRAAYLLYTYRDRLAGQGVLLVGPSAVFLRYIEQVLPSLGEHDVVLATTSSLKPRLHAVPAPPPVAVVAGDARMATVIERAVEDRQRPLRRDLAVVVGGQRVVLSRRETRRIVDAARRRRGPHNQQRQYVVRRVVDTLVGRWKTSTARAYEARRLDRERASDDRDTVFPLADPTIGAALARGEPLPEGYEGDLRRRLRRDDAVSEAIDWMWPVLSGADLVNDLLGFSALLRSAAEGVLSAEEQAVLLRPWAPLTADALWTDAHIALVDEADHRLGNVALARARKRRRRGPSDEEVAQAARVIEELGLAGTTDARSLAARFGDGADGDPVDAVTTTRTYAHVLVDEAQDLTAMQWRMLARRCPTGSMTIVGDPGQASRPGALGSWDALVDHLPKRHAPRFATLSVNYRTPAEVMDVAARLLLVAAPGIEPSTSVRSVGEQPLFRSAAPDELADAVAGVVRDRARRRGKIAVIAPVSLHDDLVARLGDLDVAAGSADALDARVAVLDATDAKGLEFDHVVVVEPAKLVTPDQAGLRLLYVTITRATQTLAVVHAEPLPEGLVPPARGAGARVA
jgi:DNA helicase IV